MNIRVLNADDHPMLRNGIVQLLTQTEGIDWVGSASDGREALEKTLSLKPDIALLDIEMPYLSGIELCQKIRDAGLKTRIILLTLFKESAYIKAAFNEGAMGYLLKEANGNEIISCIKSVHSGKRYVSPSLTDVILDSNRVEDTVLSRLTEHEINILKLIAKNKTSKEIADMMFLSIKTIANHRNNISKKLELDGQQNALLKWVLENKENL